jgi:hypothetical protein
LMGPPSRDSRRAPAAALSEDTGAVSINQDDERLSPSGPLAPPMASPMPPNDAAAYPAASLTPATGGKAPATATGGYLQAGTTWACYRPCLSLRHAPNCPGGPGCALLP